MSNVSDMRYFICKNTDRNVCATKETLRKFLSSALLWAVILFVSCEREPSAGLIKLDTNDSATHTSYYPVVQFMDSSYMRARITAGWAKIYDKHAETLLGDSITVEFFTKPDRHLASVLTADSARIDDKTKNMTASGNVVVVASGSMTTVKTSVIHWDSTRHVLHSPAFVDIRSPYELLQGYGFESDADLRHYTIFKVTGQTLLSPTGEALSSTSSTVAATSATSTQSTSNQSLPLSSPSRIKGVVR